MKKKTQTAEKTKPTIILIGGNKGAGKDFTASKLGKNIGSSTIKSFAEPLKKITATIFDISLKDLDKLKNAEEKVVLLNNRGMSKLRVLTVRELLQRLGTDALRGYISDTLWIDLLKKYIDSCDAEFVIVPDFRFKNEYTELAHSYNVVTVKVEDGIVNTDTHQSEQDLADFKFDIYIDNRAKDSSLDIEQILLYLDKDTTNVD